MWIGFQSVMVYPGWEVIIPGGKGSEFCGQNRAEPKSSVDIAVLTHPVNPGQARRVFREIILLKRIWTKPRLAVSKK